MIKEILIKTFLVLFSSFVTIFLLDVFLDQTNLRYAVERNSESRNYYVNDNEMGFDIDVNITTTSHGFSELKYDIWSNSLGCFDTEYNGEYRPIYLTGDSFTWGYASFIDKWGTLIEYYLNLPIHKCGVAGFGTLQEYIKTKNHFSIIPTPELIIVGYFGANDVENDMNFPDSVVVDGYRVKNLSSVAKNKVELDNFYNNISKYCIPIEPNNIFIQRIKCFLRNNSVIFNLVNDKARIFIQSIFSERFLNKMSITIQQDPSIETNNRNIDLLNYHPVHMDSLLKFVDLAEKYDTKLLFVLIPGKSEVMNDKDDIFIVLNNNLKKYLKEKNINYIDLAPTFKNVFNKSNIDLYWEKDGHWNISGNYLAGLLVSKYIHENNIINIQNNIKIIKNIKQQLLDKFNLNSDSIIF